MRGENDRVYIEKILSYCERIAKIVYKAKKDFNVFRETDEYYAAISMFEMQIGELSKHLSRDFIENTKDLIPWRNIKDMRNMYAHEYEKMSPKDIWSTAISDIPALAKFCEERLKNNDAP
jgi:uncharacterized protein with HEPN domain